MNPQIRISLLRTEAWKWQCPYCGSYALSLRPSYMMTTAWSKKFPILFPSPLRASDHKDWPSSCVTVNMQYFPASVTKFDRKSRPWTLIWCFYSCGPRQKNVALIIQTYYKGCRFLICCFFWNVFLFSVWGSFASYLRHFGAKISDLPVFSLHFGTTISHFGTKISHAHSICSIWELESQIWEAKITNLNGSCNIWLILISHGFRRFLGSRIFPWSPRFVRVVRVKFFDGVFSISSMVLSISWCSQISAWFQAEGLGVQCVHVSNYKQVNIRMCRYTFALNIC